MLVLLLLVVGGDFYFCTEPVREQSVFEELCCCNVGCIQVGKAFIIIISLRDCSVMLPELLVVVVVVVGEGGGSLITH